MPSPAFRRLSFLHTAPAQADAFGALLGTLAPDVSARHHVEPELLARVRAAGRIEPDVHARVQEIAAALLRDGAHVVVCTCSTLGASAEAAGVALGAPVLRIDRPMAERAVDAGSPILVAAALESSLDSTCALLRDAAGRRGATPEIRVLVCEGAWEHFEAGDRPAYHAAIAAALRRFRGDARAVVLAQASMDGAEALVVDLGIPVLSSPRSGLEAALARAHALIG